MLRAELRIRAIRRVVLSPRMASAFGAVATLAWRDAVRGIAFTIERRAAARRRCVLRRRWRRQRCEVRREIAQRRIIEIRDLRGHRRFGPRLALELDELPVKILRALAGEIREHRRRR